MSGRAGPVGVVARLLLGSAFPGRGLCGGDPGEAAAAAALDSPAGRSALTCVFVGQVIIVVLIIIFLLEAARLQVLHVHVAHVARRSNNKNMFMRADQPAFILHRLLPPPRAGTPLGSAFFPDAEVLESPSCFREEKLQNMAENISDRLRGDGRMDG